MDSKHLWKPFNTSNQWMNFHCPLKFVLISLSTTCLQVIIKLVSIVSLIDRVDACPQLVHLITCSETSIDPCPSPFQNEKRGKQSQSCPNSFIDHDINKMGIFKTTISTPNCLCWYSNPCTHIVSFHRKWKCCIERHTPLTSQLQPKSPSFSRIPYLSFYGH